MLGYGAAGTQASSQDIILLPYTNKPIYNDKENILILSKSKMNTSSPYIYIEQSIYICKGKLLCHINASIDASVLVVAYVSF